MVGTLPSWQGRPALPSRHELLSRWLPVVVWLGVIFAFSALPAGNLPSGVWPVQKLAHVGEYALLALLLQRALSGHGLRTAISSMLAWLFAIVYGASDEFHQSFVSGRNPALADVVIDGFGAALGIVTVVWLRHRRETEQNRPK
ncbi:MAG: VanZ family protein [Chloroflexota bacterium]